MHIDPVLEKEVQCCRREIENNRLLILVSSQNLSRECDLTVKPIKCNVIGLVLSEKFQLPTQKGRRQLQEIVIV